MRFQTCPSNTRRDTADGGAGPDASDLLRRSVYLTGPSKVRHGQTCRSGLSIPGQTSIVPRFACPRHPPGMPDTFWLIVCLETSGHEPRRLGERRTLKIKLSPSLFYIKSARRHPLYVGPSRRIQSADVGDCQSRRGTKNASSGAAQPPLPTRRSTQILRAACAAVLESKTAAYCQC